jgi:hypothetical protein
MGDDSRATANKSDITLDDPDMFDAFHQQYNYDDCIHDDMDEGEYMDDELVGRGQPRKYFTLSFGEIPWFDDHGNGESRPCDWLKSPHNLHIHTGHIQKSEFSDQSQRRISP